MSDAITGRALKGGKHATSWLFTLYLCGAGMDMEHLFDLDGAFAGLPWLCRDLLRLPQVFFGFAWVACLSTLVYVAHDFGRGARRKQVSEWCGNTRWAQVSDLGSLVGQSSAIGRPGFQDWRI